MCRILDIPVHHSRTPHKEPCGNSEQAAACVRLWSIAQKYCQLLKVGQVWSSHQHTPTSISDLSAWQTGSNRVLPWHVCVAGGSGVTSMSDVWGVQGTDMASDLDSGTYMQNCDPEKNVSFNFCVAWFSPLVFFSKLSASGHKYTSHHAAQHQWHSYAQLIQKISLPYLSPQGSLFSRLFWKASRTNFM